MRKAGRSSHSRFVILMLLCALALLAGATAYLYYNASRMAPAVPGPFAGAPAPEEDVDVVEARRLTAMLAMLLLSILLILAFLIGSYLLIHVGRAVVRRPIGGKRTEYVDAWSRYRITDDQIIAATIESAEERAKEAREENEPDDGSSGGGFGESFDDDEDDETDDDDREWRT